MSHYLAIAVTILGTIAAVLLVLYLHPILLLVFLSLGGAGVMRPLVDQLALRGTPRFAAVLFAYVLVLSVLVLVALVLANPLVAEAQLLLGEGGYALQNARQHWPDGTTAQRFLVRYLPLVEEPWRLFGAASFAQWRSILGWTSGLIETFAKTLVVIVLSMYWAVDRLHFERLWLSLLPLEKRITARDAWRELENEVGSYLRSEAIQSLIAGLVLDVAYRTVGYPYPTLLAVCAAVLWLIPWAGGVLAVVAAVLISLPALLAQPPADAVPPLLSAIGLTTGVFLLLELGLEPQLFNRRRYNSLLIVLMLLVFTETLGLVGLLLGPPIAVIVQTISRFWLQRRVASEKPPADVENLGVRVAALRETLEREQSPPERLSLIDRLQDLVRQAQTLY